LHPQFQRKLELPRIVGCGSLAGVGKERTDCSHVVNIGDVEHVGDEVHIKALPEVNTLRNAKIVEDRPWRDPGVAAKVAVERGERAVEIEDARLLENSCWRIFRINWLIPDRRASGVYERVGPPGERRQLEIVAVAGKDVKGTP